MKLLSLLGLFTFLVCLGLRLYSEQAQEKLDSNIVSSQKSVFKRNPKEARALLDALDEAVSSKSALNKEKEIDPRLQRYIDRTYKRFEEAFYASENNFRQLESFQDRIKKAKEQTQQPYNNLESWNLPFIFYLVIEERFKLNEINAFKDPNSLGPNYGAEKVEQMRALSQTLSFRKKMYEFKGLEFDEKEIIKKRFSLKQVTSSRALANEGEPYDNDSYYDEQVPPEPAEQYYNDPPPEKDPYLQEEKAVTLDEKLREEDYNDEQRNEIKSGYEYQESYDQEYE